MLLLLLSNVLALVIADGAPQRDDYFPDHTDLVAGQDWGFDLKSGGCNAWLDKYTQCSGKTQSPIAIPLKPGRVARGAEGWTKNFDELHDIVAYADSRGLEIFFAKGTAMVHSGIYGREKTRYIVYKFRWLFGPDCRTGSEHNIGGRHFPSEIQVFSFDSRFKTPAEAAECNGIQVTSLLFKKSKEDNPHLQHLIDSATKLHGEDIYYLQAKFEALKAIMETNSYYQYTGSLSSPPCTEHVIWDVVTDIFDISDRQLEILRSASSSTGKVTCDARRPIQPINKRKVTLVVRGDNEYEEEADRERLAGHLEHSRLRTNSHNRLRFPAENFDASFDSGSLGGFVHRIGGHVGGGHSSGGDESSRLVHGGNKRFGRFYRRNRVPEHVETFAQRRIEDEDFIRHGVGRHSNSHGGQKHVERFSRRDRVPERVDDYSFYNRGSHFAGRGRPLRNWFPVRHLEAEPSFIEYDSREAIRPRVHFGSSRDAFYRRY